MCSAVNVSNETLEMVTDQAMAADENVQRSDALLKAFGSTLRMVKIHEQTKFPSFAKCFDNLDNISDSRFGQYADVQCVEIETIHDHTDRSLFYGK